MILGSLQRAGCGGQSDAPPRSPFRNKNPIPSASGQSQQSSPCIRKCSCSRSCSCQGHPLSSTDQHKDRKPWLPGSTWDNSEGSSHLQGSWWQGLPCVCILAQCLLPTPAKNILLADVHFTVCFLGNRQRTVPDFNSPFRLCNMELPREMAVCPCQTLRNLEHRK